VKSKRPKNPASAPTLFEMEKVDPVEERAAELTLDRPHADSSLLLGTSAFTAAGWPGTFYPPTLKSTDYLSYYASRFRAVEIDSTYYGPPSESTVTNWYRKTPPDFIFAAKVPQVITHTKALLNCEPEFDEFIARMTLLNEKLGPLLFQFPHFSKYEFNGPDEFLRRLSLFLQRLKNLPNIRFVVEIRNKTWLDTRLTNLLKQHNVALALTDTSFMPRPWELKEQLDLVTADFAYVRWLGDRHGIEKVTRVWDKTVVDRTEDLRNWIDIFKSMVANKKIIKLFAFANNHYAGNGPATIKLFSELWNNQKDASSNDC
jgi:uncharacterized protein YecE (DUF72 family)